MSDTNKRTEDSYEGQTVAPLLECRSNVQRDSDDRTGAATADGDSMPVVAFIAVALSVSAPSQASRRGALRRLLASAPTATNARTARIVAGKHVFGRSRMNTTGRGGARR